jgi:hypothetical protein
MADTVHGETDLILAIDEDDLSYEGRGPQNVIVARGPRKTCPAWSNHIAAEYAGKYRAFASLGDDHLPMTPGWDVTLLSALDEMGGTGIAYGDDGLQHENMATAPVVSADIVAALGWFMYPACQYVFCDNVWMDLAREAGCLRYVPEVVIRHLHWTANLAAHDVTYAERDHLWARDEQAWRAWQADQAASDIAKVKALRGVL